MTNTLPKLVDLPVPATPLLAPLLSYVREHTSPSTYNHSLRAAYFSLFLATRFPPFASAPPGAINLELVIIACITHDLGWATTKELISSDKRFEVDGANLAVKFIEDHKDVLTADHPTSWDKHDQATLWSAIALHTSPSLSTHHPKSEIVLVTLGIMTDFFGPDLIPPFPPGLIKQEEYNTIVQNFPREGFKDELVQIFCGLCRTKPETVFDNWQAEFGTTFGLDGKGGGKEEFAKRVEERRFVPMFMGALDAREKTEPADKLSQPREKREKYWYEAE